MEDKRWQLELVPGEGACTWNLIRDVLVKAQVLNAESEDIRSISLVIGGTEDQLIHHDVSRDFVCWSDTELDEEKESNFRRVELGWEHNRIAYNEAMSNTCPQQYPHSNGEREGWLSSWNTEEGTNQPRCAQRKVFHTERGRNAVSNTAGKFRFGCHPGRSRRVPVYWRLLSCRSKELFFWFDIG